MPLAAVGTDSEHHKKDTARPTRYRVAPIAGVTHSAYRTTHSLSTLTENSESRYLVPPARYVKLTWLEPSSGVGVAITVPVKRGRAQCSTGDFKNRTA